MPTKHFTANAGKVIGLDTGFFFQLEDGKSQAAEVFARLQSGQEEKGAISTITFFEVTRHGLRGALPERIVELISENAPTAFTVAGVDAPAVLSRAARIAHDMGLAMADALIAASLEEVGCQRLYITDSDFDDNYEGPMEVVLLS